MKDKLRELAERLRRHHSQNGGAIEYIQCANELRSILDAEGDGGVVCVGIACDSFPASQGLGYCHMFYHADRLPKGTKLFTHPARSVVVSDDVWPQVDRMLVDAWLLGTESEKLDMLKMRERYASLKSAIQPPQPVRSVSDDECPACHKNWGEHRSGYSAAQCKRKPQKQVARSVSDEDVEACAKVYDESWSKALHNRDCMRAALEHFAARAEQDKPHDQD